MSNKKRDYGSSLEYASDVMNYMYIFLMFTVYLLIIHNKYFDITKTKYSCFMCVSLIYIASLGLLKIIQYVLNKTDGDKKNHVLEGYKHNIPVCMMMLFMTANMMACYMGDTHAIYGDKGRFMGFLTYIVIGFAFILMAYEYKGYDSLYVVLAAVIIFTLVMALIQHTGYDLFGLKQNISEKQYKKFISTFGNINIFASYLVIVTGVAMGAYMYVRKHIEKYFRIILKICYAIVLFLLGMTLMTANSDSVYLGIGVIMVVAFFISYRHDELRLFAEASFFMAAGNLVLTICHTKMKKVPSYGGLTKKLDNIKLATALLVAIVVFYILVILIEAIKKKYNKKALNKNIGTCILCVLMLVAMAVFVAKGIKSGDSLFKFDYKWGTYRGYIWTKSVESFEEAPVINKIFGYGNESIRQVITEPNYQDMMNETKRIYDNSHNEILQYLVTLGLYGSITYIMLVGGSIWYMIKYGKRDMHTYISVFATVGYFAQALVNINQPITTPFYFALMSLGVGYASYSRRLNKEE